MLKQQSAVSLEERGLIQYWLARAGTRLAYYEEAAQAGEDAACLLQGSAYLEEYCLSLNIAGGVQVVLLDYSHGKRLIRQALKHDARLRKEAPETAVKLWANLSNLHVHTTDYDSAYWAASTARSIDENLLEREPSVYHILYNVLLRKSAYQDALEAALINLELTEKKKDTLRMGLALAAVSNVAHHLGLHKLSADYAERGLVWCKGDALPAYVCDELQLRAGFAYQANQQNEKAELHFRHCVQAYAHDPETLATVWVGLSKISEAQGALSEALAHITQAETALARMTPRSHFEVVVLEQKAHLLKTAGFISSAAAEIHKALSVAREMNVPARDIARILKTMDEIDPAGLDAPTWRILFQIEDSLQRDEMEAHKKLAVRYETEKQQKAIVKQELELLKKERQNQWGFIILLLAITGFFVTFSLYLRSRNRGLKQQMEAARIIDEATRKTEELRAFNYTIGHDLNNPISQIQLELEQLRDNLQAWGEDEVVIKVADILHYADYSKELLTGVVRYATLEQVQLSSGQLNTSQVLKFLAELEKKASGRTDVEIHLPDFIPDLPGDPLLLRQVLQNLLQNAIKYSQHSHPALIRITFEETKEWISLSISDNGVGFPAEAGSSIFQLFKTAHPKAAFSGSGIGLAIVERIVSRHGGKVWAHSEGPGTGATFTFQLPVTVTN